MTVFAGKQWRIQERGPAPPLLPQGLDGSPPPSPPPIRRSGSATSKVPFSCFKFSKNQRKGRQVNSEPQGSWSIPCVIEKEGETREIFPDFNSFSSRFLSITHYFTSI